MAEPTDSLFNKNITLDKDGHPVAVAIETSEFLVLTQDERAAASDFQVPSSADLTVTGDVVRIRGPIIVPGKRIRIYARILDLENDSNGKKPALIVDGAEGKPGDPWTIHAPNGNKGAAGKNYKQPIPSHKDEPGGPGQTAKRIKGWPSDTYQPELNGKAGATGMPGSPGGSVAVVCEQLTGGDSLTLSARGGRGGNGAQGQQGGRGGDGGVGADGKIGHYMLIGDRNATAGGPGGDGGDGGTGGAAGQGGAGGAVKFVSVQGDPKKIIASVDAGNAGTPGKGGNPGARGEGGRGGETYEASLGSAMGRAPDGKPGKAGNPGHTGPAAPESPLGLQTILGSANYTELAPYFSITQSQMVMEKFRAAYLSADQADPKPFSTAAAYALWLKNILEPLATGQVSQSDADTALAKSLWAQSLGYRLYLKQNLDYFGKAPSWVPLASLDFYKKGLASTVPVLKDVETAYKAYFTAGIQQQEAIAQLQSTRSQLEQHQSNLKKQIGDLIGEAGEIATQINASEDSLPAAQADLEDKIKNFENAIESSFSGLNLAQLMRVLQNLAFTPSAGFQKYAMIGSQVGTLANDLGSVTTDSGVLMEKNYIVEKLDIIGQDVADLKEGYQETQKRVTVDDPNAYMLLQDEQQFDQMVDNFISMSSAKDAEQSMSNYVALVRQRNNKILDYNALWANVASLQGEVDTLAEQSKQVFAQLDQQADPGLPLMANYLSGLYRSTMAVSIQQLYRVSRAYTFWSLESYPAFHDLLGLNDPGSVNSETLEAGQVQLLGRVTQTMEQRGSEAQSFPDNPDGKGIEIVLDTQSHPAVFGKLLSGAPAEFFLQAPSPDATSEQSAFVGMSDVRIIKARAWLHGAATSDRRFHVVLTHLGLEDFFSPEGLPVRLSHSAVTKAFIYDQTATGTSIFSDGNIGNAAENANYAPLGPFTTWRIAIPSKDNQTLDLSGLDRISLEFHGTFFPFVENALKS